MKRAVRNSTHKGQLMQTISLELCRKLYALSGWGDTFAHYETTGHDVTVDAVYPELNQKYGLWGTQEVKEMCPLYDSSYMMCMLPTTIVDHKDTYVLTIEKTNSDRYRAGYGDRYYSEANSLENALIKLAIALFEQGHLKKDGTK